MKSTKCKVQIGYLNALLNRYVISCLLKESIASTNLGLGTAFHRLGATVSKP